MSNANKTKNGLNQENLRPMIEQIDKFYKGKVLILTEW